MNLLHKKFQAISILALLASQCFGVDDMQMRNLENRVNTLEQAKSSKGVINPPARPVVKSGFDFWLQGEALYMQAREDDLNYSILINSTNDGHTKKVTYDWSWGFRLGTGWNFQHDGWDLLFDWTSFHTENTNRKMTDFTTNVNLVVWGDSQASVGIAQLAQGVAKLRMNFFDLELGREFFVSKWLALRPFIGGRGAWVHRNFRVMYQTLGPEIPLDKDVVHLMNRFNGGGARIGLDTKWMMGMGWSFVADAAFSLLYGSQHLHHHQVVREINQTLVDVDHVDNTWTALRSMMDLSLGVRWDKLFYNNRYRIALQAGWEQHVLFGFDKDMNFIHLRRLASGKYFNYNGDLSLSGVAFQARFDF